MINNCSTIKFYSNIYHCRFELFLWKVSIVLESSCMSKWSWTVLTTFNLGRGLLVSNFTSNKITLNTFLCTLQVIARKGTAKLYLKPAALIVTQQAQIDEKYNNVPRRKPERTEKQCTATAAAPAAKPVEPLAHREKSKAKDGKPQKTKPVSPPLSPRGPPGYMKASSPMSLTRDELKDQVVLYKEQVSSWD